jgi:hypothetical protein
MLGWKKRPLRLLIIVMLTVLSGMFAQQPPDEQVSANVAGKWTIYSKNDNGKTDTKSIELKQDGQKLSGHFKGPNQSGGIEGTVEGRHIVFHTKTKHVLTFRGEADDQGMYGRWGIFLPRKGEMHGEWEARRTD